MIGLMKVLETPHLAITRDLRIKYTLDTKQSNDLAQASARLVVMLCKDKMTHKLMGFSQIERKQIAAFAERLRQKFPAFRHPC
ncbi:hypothetical protein FACS1894167_15840 [Synergistales bacterium]|nr:hypothetical protein FACS1894167_15840 [Synergistales bacterium]